MAKLPDGVTVYHGAHKFEGECPDDLMPTSDMQPFAGATKSAGVEASEKSDKTGERK